MELSDFENRVIKKLAEIPLGRVTSYASLARAIDRPLAARAVGNALNKNPFAPHLACHRVIKGSGALGGFAGGVKKKARLLRQEGIIIKNNKVINFKEIFFNFD